MIQFEINDGDEQNRAKFCETRASAYKGTPVEVVRKKQKCKIKWLVKQANPKNKMLCIFVV